MFDLLQNKVNISKIFIDISLNAAGTQITSEPPWKSYNIAINGHLKNPGKG